ncbi:hypothetical protein FS749_011499 [Ceratobasidium sp. UAMH 11750]|nr:hypothetical protein FS749_011499 [Ceratobasidium sp. UAMH 11750]
MSPSILVKSMSSADALLVVSITVAFVVYLALAGLECYYMACSHPYRAAVIVIELCLVGYTSYGNEEATKSVSVATSQPASSPPPRCAPAQEPTSAAPRSSHPKSKSEHKVKPERTVKSEPKVKSKSASKHQPERAHKPDPKPQRAASQRSSPPHLGPSANRNDLFGLSSRSANTPTPIRSLDPRAPRGSLAPPPRIVQLKPAPEPRQQPRRRRFDPPSHVSDIFAPKFKPGSSTPADAVDERSTTPATTSPRRGTSAQSHPQAQESAPPRAPSPAQELTGRIRPPSPGSTPLPDAKRQRTLDSLLSLTGLVTPGPHGAQSNLPSAPSLKLEDLARPSHPSPAPEHPGSPMLLDSPRPDLSRTPPPVLLDSPRPDAPSQPRSMPTPASDYMHGPRVSIAETIRLRIDFDDLSLSVLPPQDEDMRGPGMGDMDTDGDEEPRVFIEQGTR